MKGDEAINILLLRSKTSVSWSAETITLPPEQTSVSWSTETITRHSEQGSIVLLRSNLRVLE
jgi:hypothetical protein